MSEMQDQHRGCSQTSAEQSQAQPSGVMSGDVMQSGNCTWVCSALF